jgi:O-antigen ligase
VAALDEVIVESGEDVPTPTLPEGRPATIDQIIENITSIFSSVEDEGLEGTKAFRLRWWSAIVGYTVFGDHFWTGKGFGINLADADGFQANEDRSLRAPHNSHITALARMGVPGLALWAAVQLAFGFGLLRASLRSRARGDTLVAATGAWVLVYWLAMMINTSFDPYLEGPQGGIWFWSLIGLGMVIMTRTREPDLE